MTGSPVQAATVTIIPREGEPIVLRDGLLVGDYDQDMSVSGHFLQYEGDYGLRATKTGYSDFTSTFHWTHAYGSCNPELMLNIQLVPLAH